MPATTPARTAADNAGGEAAAVVAVVVVLGAAQLPGAALVVAPVLMKALEVATGARPGPRAVPGTAALDMAAPPRATTQLMTMLGVTLPMLHLPPWVPRASSSQLRLPTWRMFSRPIPHMVGPLWGRKMMPTHQFTILTMM
mmetsp:Transcript_44399/g.72462  ORF Transcript_44399/g.72462 Transcript_44399/m.72462 type:complete len:141 (+) Transcript_44399:270-692(+)